MNVLESILNTIPGLEVASEFPQDIKDSVTTFALNVVLVLEGVKFAYIPNLVEFNNKLVTYVQSICDISVVEYDQDYILTLNKETVLSLLKRNTCSSLSKILGHVYDKTKCYSRDYYYFDYKYQKNGYEGRLLMYKIPGSIYTGDTQAQNTLNEIDKVLCKYGYSTVMDFDYVF